MEIKYCDRVYDEEKVEIAKRHLLPKSIGKNTD